MTRTYWIAALLVALATLAASAAVYPILPDRVPIHWNIRGEIDGYSSRAFGAFFFPAIILAVIGLLALLPRLTPRSMSIDNFRETYAYIVLLVVCLFGYLHTLTLLAATGHAPDFPRALLGGLFLFLAMMGNVLGRVTRNPYVGIKVPWTLASDRVWNATHRLAAWLFVACGLLGLVFLAARAPIWVSPIPIAFAAIIPVIYSFVISRNVEETS